MSVYYITQSQCILVSGKTYPYREVLRNLGGQYQAQDKSWLLPLNDESLQKIEELCRTIGGGPQKVARPAPAPAPASAPPPRAAAAAAAAIPNETLVSDAGFEPVTSLHGEGLTIAELMQKLQLAISHSFPRSLWVMGEIQNFRQTATGSYFQLADFKEGASRSATMTVNATIWRSQWLDMERKLGRDTLKELMADGLRVRMLVDISLFKDRGQISLQVQGIDPTFTKGSLALAREKLLRELRTKGLDQKNKQLPWPAFPLRIGLISADESRAKSDFLDQLLVYGFPGQVLFFPAQMQGENTLRDVVSGIQALEARHCDMIVITRGGGSAADLRWFDSPEIAYSITAARVPIVAAIGHHEDVCVAEEISARREKTPTAAADFCVHLLQKTRERIEQLSLVMSRSMDERVRLQTQILQNLKARLHLGTKQLTHQHESHLQTVRNELQMRSERRLMQWTTQTQNLRQNLFQRLQFLLREQTNRRQRLSQDLHHRALTALLPKRYEIEDQKRALGSMMRETLQQQREKILHLEKLLIQSDPQPWMAQGWTQLFAEGRKLDRADQLEPGMHVRARLIDALLELKLESLTRLDPNKSAIKKESSL
ncbi:MAG TPA: exodeoxyribonuclease VII large subunit [Oligoflexus sp.]|uniref:exodeoxyribonuclease VII large subunit n=1 Tax=Oligoflexus sp. TaxID=1971216 RepID=UPI002D2BF70D|nr:exodeoxyribonuclease VII large subunit [Oligoflexus sp.]HYX33072.1 exodeoxyribonuclease VII large subunit [Oligoflexus sp.]